MRISHEDYLKREMYRLFHADMFKVRVNEDSLDRLDWDTLRSLKTDVSFIQQIICDFVEHGKVVILAANGNYIKLKRNGTTLVIRIPRPYPTFFKLQAFLSTLKTKISNLLEQKEALEKAYRRIYIPKLSLEYKENGDDIVITKIKNILIKDKIYDIGLENGVAGIVVTERIEFHPAIQEVIDRFFNTQIKLYGRVVSVRFRNIDIEPNIINQSGLIYIIKTFKKAGEELALILDNTKPIIDVYINNPKRYYRALYDAEFEVKDFIWYIKSTLKQTRTSNTKTVEI